MEEWATKLTAVLNYENDSSDRCTRLRLTCRSVFSLEQTAAKRGAGDARRRFEIGCGTLATGHNESSRSKKKLRIADYDTEHAGTRFSHARLAIVVARFFL